MNESERMLRLTENRYQEFEEADRADRILAERIIALLNHPKIDKHSIVDAFYYDSCEIPDDIQKKLKLWRDQYLVFGITSEATLISKWVDRWDLDSEYPIVDGKVIRPKKTDQSFITTTKPPLIHEKFSTVLLSAPVSEMKI